MTIKKPLVVNNDKHSEILDVDKLDVGCLSIATDSMLVDDSGTLTTQITASDSISASVSGQGIVTNPLSVAVKVSPAAGNALTATAQGLFVNASVGIVTENSQTVYISGNGTSGSPLEAQVSISTLIGNSLSIQDDGLYSLPFDGILSNNTNTIQLEGDGLAESVLEASVIVNTNDNNLINVPDEFTLGLAAYLNHQDTTSVAFTGAGSITNPLMGEVLLSEESDNILVIAEDGLYAPPSQTDIITQNSETVGFAGNGGAIPLTAAVLVSGDDDNVLEVVADGLKVASLVTNDSDVITFSGDGTLTDPLEGELLVSSNSANLLRIAGEGVLATITGGTTSSVTIVGNGTPTVPLQGVVRVSSDTTNRLQIIPTGGTTGVYVENIFIDETNTLTLLGQATQNSKLRGNVKISADADNSLISKTDGLYVPTPSFLSAVYHNDTNSVSLSGDGNSGTPLSANIKVDPIAGNLLQLGSDGTSALLSVQSTESISFSGNGTSGNKLTAHAVISTVANNKASMEVDGIYAAPFTPSGMSNLTVVVGTAYQGSSSAAYEINIIVEAIQAITIAGTVNDVLELWVGDTAAVATTGGQKYDSWRAQITGILTLVGAGVGQRGKLRAVVPKGKYFAVRRISGTLATIVESFLQTYQ